MPNYNGYISDKSRKDFQNQQIEGKIVHLFEHTVNLVLNNQFPNLLTVGDLLIQGSPNSLAFPDFQAFRPELREGDPFLLIEGKILIGPNFQGRLRMTKEEQGKRIYRRAGHSRIGYLRQVLTTLEIDQKYPSAAPFYQQLFKEIQQFKDAMHLQDERGIQTSVRRLIGLGIGLTPSGDDFLTGFILAFREESIRNYQLREILTREWHQTNLISQHQLYFANQGRAKSSLIQVVDALGTEGETLIDFPAAVAETLAVGSTSGHDLLLGVLAGFDLLNEKGEEKNEFSRKNNFQSLH